MRSTKDDPDPAAPPLLGDIISGPTNFRHVVHATFDTSTAKFSGLPTQWHAKAGIFNRQFGVPLGSAPRIEVDGYSARIPAVLVLLRRELVNHDGLRQEGIFRVPASKMAQQTYKEQLDAGQFRGCSSYEDAPCMAALIKEWFRSLPVPLLNCLSRDRIVATAENQNGHAAAQDLIHELPEPNQSIFMWLLDLLADTACFEATNRMNVKALGIVLAPNLYTVPQTSSPMEVVALMDAAVRSVQACLRMRAETAHRPKMIGI